MQQYATYYEDFIKALVRGGYDEFIICKSADNDGSKGLANWDLFGCIDDEEAASRILIVGSLAKNKDGVKVSSFSSCGTRVDVLAPGSDIYSTIYSTTGEGDASIPYSDYGYMSGTSMATPMVAGVAALVKSANPELKGHQIKKIICDTASGSYADKTGVTKGKVDAEAAVKRAKGISSEESEHAAVDFVRTWYDDWSYDDSVFSENDNSLTDRCLPLIDETSDLYRGFSVQPPSKAAYRGLDDISTCIIEGPTLVESSGSTYRVSIWYTSLQESNWNAESVSYDWLISSRAHEASWDVTVDSTGKVTTLSVAPRGPYSLTGSVHVHEETNASAQPVAVASIVLDEPITYLYEYKWTSEGEAKDVLLETSDSDGYGEWAQYDGQHITVECDGLQGAYHDASYWKVDTLATGKIWLLNSSNQDMSLSDPNTHRDEIESHSKGPFAYTYQLDFDSDGMIESFVVTGTDDTTLRPGMLNDGELWYIDSNGEVAKVASFNGYFDCPVAPDGSTFSSHGYTFLSFMDWGDSGGPIKARVIGVKGGHAHEMSSDVDGLSWMLSDEDGQVYGCQYVDGIGQYQRYDMSLDVESFVFVSQGPVGEPFYAG